VVYKALDPRLNRPVAVKMLLDGADAPSAVAERFLIEARAAALLRPPNVVAIYDYGRQGGEPYFVMASAGGGSLSAHRYGFLNDARAAVVLAEKVARAVQHAHEHGILHRDLKPGNILLDDLGEPLVADFGLARLLDTDSELTATEAAIGTLPYMSPEQAG